MSGGQLAALISAIVSANGVLIGILAFLVKRFFPKMVNDYMKFVFTEFAQLRVDNKLERDKFVDSINQLTTLASNHLTDFSREICEKLDCMAQSIIQSNATALQSNQMKDETLEGLNLLLCKLVESVSPEKGGE